MPVPRFELARLAVQVINLHLAGQGARIVHRSQRDTKPFAYSLYLGFDGGCPLAPFPEGHEAMPSWGYWL
jgi:hypothetical protein